MRAGAHIATVLTGFGFGFGLFAGPNGAGAQLMDDRPAAMRPPSEQVSCLSLDPNGKTLPNPNVSAICGQFDALRQACELQRMASSEPMMSGNGCFAWRMMDVRPGAGGRGAPGTRAQIQGGGNSGAGGGR